MVNSPVGVRRILAGGSIVLLVAGNALAQSGESVQDKRPEPTSQADSGHDDLLDASGEPSAETAEPENGSPVASPSAPAQDGVQLVEPTIPFECLMVGPQAIPKLCPPYDPNAIVVWFEADSADVQLESLVSQYGLTPAGVRITSVPGSKIGEKLSVPPRTALYWREILKDFPGVVGVEAWRPLVPYEKATLWYGPDRTREQTLPLRQELNPGQAPPQRAEPQDFGLHKFEVEPNGHFAAARLHSLVRDAPDSISRFVQNKYGKQRVTVIGTNPHFGDYRINGLKDEVVKGANGWERLHLSVVIAPLRKARAADIFLFVSGDIAYSMGDEPPTANDRYETLSKNHPRELNDYVKMLGEEIKSHLKEQR